MRRNWSLPLVGRNSEKQHNDYRVDKIGKLGREVELLTRLVHWMVPPSVVDHELENSHSQFENTFGITFSVWAMTWVKHQGWTSRIPRILNLDDSVGWLNMVKRVFDYHDVDERSTLWLSTSRDVLQLGGNICKSLAKEIVKVKIIIERRWRKSCVSNFSILTTLKPFIRTCTTSNKWEVS